MTLPLRVFEPRYLQMIDDCLNGDPIFGVLLIKEGEEVGGPVEPYEIGTTARILAVERKAHGVLHITTIGEERFQLHSVCADDKPYLIGDIELYTFQDTETSQVSALFDIELALLSAYLELLSQASDVEIRLQRAPETPEAMAHFVATLLQVPLPIKQQLLSIADLAVLLHREVVLLEGEITALTVMLRGGELLAVEDTRSWLSGN